MTKLELIKMYTVLDELLKLDKLNTRCAYALYKNKKMLQEEAEILIALGKPPQSLLDYETKRTELCKEFADKDEMKKPLTEGKNYKIVARKQEFDEELRLLSDEYKDILDGRQTKIEDLNKILKEEINGFQFHKIKLEWLPEQIAGAAMSVLDFIIED